MTAKKRAAKKSSVAKKMSYSAEDDDAEDMGKASTGIGEVEVYTKHGVDHLVFVDVLPPSTSEAIPQNEEGVAQEANVPHSEVESGDEDWSTDNALVEELGSDFAELFELQRQNFIKKQDKKGDIPGMMADDIGAEDDSNAPQPKKSRRKPRKSSNNPSSANPPPSMEQPPSSTQEHPSRA
ncbi:hypothetical protein Ancab_011540 [Ancistrocladus abbreviatus]